MSELLPIGWAQVPIGTFARIVGGGTPPSKDPANFAPVGQGIPWVTPADLSGYRVQTIERGARDLSSIGLAACGATLMPKGTVLFSSRAPIGYVAIAANEISTNQGFKSFVLPDGFDPRFTYYQLKHLKPEAEAIATGTTFKELSGSAAATLPFQVAPLPEQTRIADQLDKLLARIQSCNDRLDAIPALLKRFRQSVLAAATSGNLTEDWRIEHPNADMVSLISILPTSEKVRRGVSAAALPATDYVDSWGYPKTWWKGTAGSLLRKGVFIDLKDGNHGANHPVVSDFTETGLPFITAAQVDRFVINYDSAYKITGRPLKKIRVGFAKSGDVVLTHKGSVGRVGVIDRDCVLTPQTTYYRLNSEFVQSRYLMYFMASMPFSGQLDDIKSQTTRDFVPITQQYVLIHLLPPFEEQTEIVHRVDALFNLADRIEAHYTAARTQAQRITPLLLAKAFRGELVPQDPNYEPASALLESIKRERAKAAAQPRPRKSSAGRKPVRAPKENTAMTKSRQDDDVQGQPYLARHLRLIGGVASAEALFNAVELPVADFYKQLAWEVEQGHLRDGRTVLELGDAA